MKRYYLVSVDYDNKRFPFRNQVFEAMSEKDAIDKYHNSCPRIDHDEILSIKAKYLGVSENISRFLERVFARILMYLSIPYYYLAIVTRNVSRVSSFFYNLLPIRKCPCCTGKRK